MLSTAPGGTMVEQALQDGGIHVRPLSHFAQVLAAVLAVNAKGGGTHPRQRLTSIVHNKIFYLLNWSVNH